ncbi:Squalene/phytoene synthase-domain-containing protein [Cunninghamella echinulata]|nr:Squalene/phytoene synthase-domain-containing protein [Cunninghamella echinulata]
MTKLDKVKSGLLIGVLWITPLIYHFSIILQKSIHTSLTTTTTSSTLYTLYQQQQQQKNETMLNNLFNSSIFQWNNDYYKTVMMDTLALSLLTGMALYLWAFITRWHFAILYIGVLDSPLKNQCLRYSGSIFFILLGYLSMSNKKNNEMCSMFSTLCFVLGLLWQYSGPYFYRRRKAMLISVSLSSLMGFFYQKSIQSSSSSMMLHWQFQDWFILMLAVVSTSCLMDNADAILNTYPQLITFSSEKQTQLQTPYELFYWQSLWVIINDILPHQHELCPDPVEDLIKVIELLGPASRSWKTMAALFPTNLRQDLCILYGFFRACDDLIDDPPTMERRKSNLNLIRAYFRLLLNHSSKKDASSSPLLSAHNNNNTTTTATTAAASMLQLSKTTDITLLDHQQVHWLSLYQNLDRHDLHFASFRSLARIANQLCPQAADELCNAWKMDLAGKPIQNQHELLHYAALISGKFGELCTCVIMYKTGHGNWNGQDKIHRDDQVLARASATGQCLQLVNIARDILADSMDSRCYVPLNFMPNKEMYHLFKSKKAIHHISNQVVKSYSERILDLADRVSDKAQIGIDGLPEEVQDGIRAAFEIYMAIGPVIRKGLVFPLRAKVPTWKKQWIAFRCIYGFRMNVIRSFKSTWSKTISSTTKSQ